MNPLSSRLASLRRKVRLLDGWQGVCALLSLLVGAVLIAGLLDWLLQLPSLVRGGLLVGILAGAGIVAYRFLFRPFSSPCDDLTLALRVEKEFPELNDALGSTVQFLSESPDSPGAAASSQAMRKKAVQLAVAKAEQYDFSRIISYRSALILGASLVVLLAVAGHFAYRHAEFSGIAVVRLADPFGGHTWTSVDVPKAPVKVAVAQPLVVKAVFSGVIPQRVSVVIMDQRPGQEQQPPEQKNIDLKAGADSVVIPWDVTKYNRDFKFRVVANDGSFPAQPGKWHYVTVLEPPNLVAMSNGQPSPQIEVFPPAYTEEPSPQKLTPGTKMIKAWAGSAVVFRAATNRPVTNVWFEYRPRNIQLGPPVPALRASTLFSQLATGSPLAAVGDLFVGQTVWERVPAELDADGKSFTVRFTAWMSGVCMLHLEDKDTLPHPYTFELDVDLDPLPNVKLVQPAANVTLLPDAEVGFKFRAEDETFALRTVFVEYEVRRGLDDKVGSGLKRAVLKLPPGYEKGLPQVHAPLVFSETNTTEALKEKPKRVEVFSTWALRNRFQIGDFVSVQVRADDYCDVYGVRVPGESHAITLEIVGKSRLAKEIDDKLKQVQQDLKTVKKMQEEAHDIVKDVQGKDKITPKDVERIVEAEEKQKAINEKIGDSDDGLRKQIDKLQQMLKDNKMKDSEAQLQAGMIKGALDQLARQELPQIDQALADARKQLANDASKDAKDKKDPNGPKDQDPKKKQDPLSKSEKLQASTLKNLKELEQALAPWADMQDVKETARSILEQQQRIKKELDTVKADKEKFDDTNPSAPEKQEKEKEFKNQLEKDAGQLADLAQRAEKLKDQLDKMEQTRRKKDDKENADRLKEASRIADKADLPTKLKETAKELKNTADNPRKDQVPSNQAQQQQQKNIDNLEKIIAALDGKDDVAEGIKKKQIKKAQEKVEELAKENQDLKNQVKDANEKLKDDEEKLKSKREELAKKFEELQLKLEDEARELARLQEQRAAKNVAQAAEEAGNAGKKLGNNQNPDEEENNAKQKLDQAQKDLKESEDELAREQLARIADKLKGLKERQDEAIERSKEFTKRLLARKSWNDALGRSLEGDATAQEGLAKEVRSLKEKLKEAKVFEHIMERSAKSMDEAVGVMRDRRQQGMAQGQVDLKAGQLQDEDQLEFDSQKSKETVKHQTQAGERLQRLLDSIKEELAKQQPEKKEQAKNGEPEQPPPDGPKAAPGDGIPPMAQLKALRAEQIDLNERTEEFTRRNPDTMKLNAEQRRELEQLQLDQRNLQELFLQMTAMPEMKGDAP